MPPSTYNTCPLTKFDASDARNTAGPSRSSIVPQRLAGVLDMMNELNGLPGVRRGAVCGVAIYQGPIPSHWRLLEPYSEQILRVNIFSPPFAAAYADTVSRPSSLIIEQMLMILP